MSTQVPPQSLGISAPGSAQRLLATVLRRPRVALSRLGRAVELLRSEGLGALVERLRASSQGVGSPQHADYQRWIAQCDTVSAAELEALRMQGEGWVYQPRISLLMPTFNSQPHWLQAAIDSVRAQVYPHWELCIADDNSTQPQVREVLKRYAAQDPRIKVIYRASTGRIAVATNTAATLATGEFIGFLDHDDELRPHTLACVVQELQHHPEADLLYTDEDKITEGGVRHAPHWKPDWDPELLLAQNYVCHFVAVRRALFEGLGGLRAEVDGAQDWDLVWRVAERTSADRIRHIPRILYHWRVVGGSTAVSASEKPYVRLAQQEVVRSHLLRSGDDRSQVELLPGSWRLRVRRAAPLTPARVAVVVTDEGARHPCAPRRPAPSNRPSAAEVAAALQRCGAPELTDQIAVALLEWHGGEGSTAPLLPAAVRLNAAVRERGASDLLLLVDRSVVTPPQQWFSELLVQGIRSGVGVVGVRIRGADGRLFHAGLTLTPEGGVTRSGAGLRRHALGYFQRTVLPHGVSAVASECVAIRRDLFERLGGFDPSFTSVQGAVIDLCLRVRRAGYQVLYAPSVEVQVQQDGCGAADAVVPAADRALLRARWPEDLQRAPLIGDGYFW